MNKRKILVVEDDPIWVENFKRIIKKSKFFEFIYASDIKSAIDALKKQKIQLIFLDLLLPDSPSAKDTLKTITKQAKYLPIVITTIVQDENVKNIASKFGVKNYLIKDQYSENEFFQVVREAIGDTINEIEFTLKNKLNRIISDLKNLSAELENSAKEVS